MRDSWRQVRRRKWKIIQVLRTKSQVKFRSLAYNRHFNNFTCCAVHDVQGIVQFERWRGTRDKNRLEVRKSNMYESQRR